MPVLLSSFLVVSLASLESGLSSLSLWSAGPGRTRLALPAAFLDGLAGVLLSDVVGESPFQSWGGSVEVRVWVGALPPAGEAVPFPLLSGEGFVQQALACSPHAAAFVFDVLASPAV